jgi:hypothetical protein
MEQPGKRDLVRGRLMREGDVPQRSACEQAALERAPADKRYPFLLAIPNDVIAGPVGDVVAILNRSDLHDPSCPLDLFDGNV